MDLVTILELNIKQMLLNKARFIVQFALNYVSTFINNIKERGMHTIPFLTSKHTLVYPC